MNEMKAELTAETQRRRGQKAMYDDLISGFGSSLRLCASAVILSLACLVGAVNAAEEKGKILYQNDFSKGEVGKLPDEMLLLDGGFAVQEINGNKVLQLPGAPLDTFGVLFGPTESANLAISARVHSTKKGRREPAFAVGLNGNAGYRLQVSAAKKLLELYKGDDLVAKEDYSWESDSWTMLKLQVRKVKDGEFAVEGKVWKHGTPEPDKWTVTHTENAEPLAGRASIWGNPFAGTPLDFDDLVVRSLQ
jgi:hypothetical protein